MIKPKQRRKAVSIRITAEAVEALEQLAAKYGTSQGQVIEQLLLTYGPTILKSKK